MSDIGDGVVFGAKLLTAMATGVILAGAGSYYAGHEMAKLGTVSVQVNDEQKTLIRNNAVCMADLQASFEKAVEKLNQAPRDVIGANSVVKLKLPTPANKNCAP